jgi:hypothetical protein
MLMNVDAHFQRFLEHKYPKYNLETILKPLLKNEINVYEIPLGNISLFNTSHSIDIRPGPVSKRLIEIVINNKSSSYPPTNPSDIEPGQKASIEVTVGTDKVMGGDLNIIDHYSVQVNGQ